MRTFDAAEVRDALPFKELIEAIASALAESAADVDLGVQSPERQSFTVEVPETDDATLLLMPAWHPGRYIGVKAVTYFPSNAGGTVPTISAGYLLFDGGTGQLVAVFDGDELTARRTAAASALAASHLARPDAKRLLVVGTGQLAPNVALAHSTVRTFDSISIWGRDQSKAGQTVEALAARGLEAEAVSDLDSAVAEADVISCVTGATTPLVRGELLRHGAHVDLIGSFKPDMRESDDAVVSRAEIFVDTRSGALQAGDLSQPLAAGVITEDDIEADLEALAAGLHPGRQAADQITLFKSAGFALEDLAAARLAVGG